VEIGRDGVLANVVSSYEPFKIELIASTDGSAVVLNLRGELDYLTIESLRAYVARLPAQEIVIRLDDLSFLDSSGLALFLELKRPGRSVRFEGITGQVRDTMRRTGTLAAIEA
jgi:anti-anti-sigma factor